MAGPAKAQRSSISRELALASIPVCNPQVRREAMPSGRVLLSGPVAATRLKRWLGTAAQAKSFELDALGDEVWRQCDGRTPVEQMVRAFAAAHRVNLREAEVAVIGFINMLLKRNLLALVAPEQPQRRQRKDIRNGR